ncbi:HalOD1 output domain-containing protein [Halopiger djelfimassiliensis]|uniref:HalOD1 output domain-containing protein n=1 Tax=Halopiger djelfimassiliensis TaxID=1293047 RepID=UPI0006778B89|nr:HalOD1 output domain-containing protein [Halopiger djelfimassiliensis]
MSNSSISSADDGFDGSVSIAVVTAIAARRNVAPTELPPLYEWIDPDALDALFEPSRTRGPRRGRLEFHYDGHDVVVECTDDLEITVDGKPIADPVSTATVGMSDESVTGV